MWLLILYLTDTQSTIFSYPLWRECYSEQVRIEAEFRQAYPGFEDYRFECVKRSR